MALFNQPSDAVLRFFIEMPHRITTSRFLYRHCFRKEFWFFIHCVSGKLGFCKTRFVGIELNTTTSILFLAGDTLNILPSE